EQGPDKSTPREIVAQGHNPRQKASKSPKLGVSPPPLVAITDAAKAANAGPPAESGVDSGQITRKRADRVPARRASLLQQGSSRVDGGFSPRLKVRPAPQPS